MFQVSGFKVSGFGVFDVFWAYGLRFWFSWFGDFRCRGLGVSGFGLPGFRFLVSTYKCLGFLGEGFRGRGVSAFQGLGLLDFCVSGCFGFEQSVSISSPCCEKPRSNSPPHPSVYTFPGPIKVHPGGAWYNDLGVGVF